ncbi:uncharacterized protein LOC132555903 [Ylistrum balloti]|uniref:uncharacterized protein LOC132555903 n=1 Tax=Ylistrum balloti TaxID=509963 RepID=UPI002905C949|nr:uncharacterized protein LOC132555903 [Ylistrum balloti]
MPVISALLILPIGVTRVAYNQYKPHESHSENSDFPQDEACSISIIAPPLATSSSSYYRFFSLPWARIHRDLSLSSVFVSSFSSIPKTAAAPAENEFSLVKTADSASSPIKIGHVVQLELTISFKAGSTDMVVELFTPDNINTAMILCDVQLVRQGSLSYTGSTTPTYESKDGTINYDRVIIDVGVVTNSLCNTLEQCQMVFSYNAIMIENPSIVSGSTHYVSAGAEYDNKEFIWIGQFAFDLYQDKTVAEQPTVDWSGPSEVPIGSSIIYTASLYLPNPSVDVVFAAYTPLNTSSVMSVCSAKIKSMGSNFNCGFDSNGVTTTPYTALTGIGNSMMEINGGRVVNKGSRHTRDAQNDNVIEFEVIYHKYLDTSHVDQSYDAGASLDLSGSQIWAATHSFKVIPEDIDTSMPSATVSIDPGIDSNVEIKKPVMVTISIEIPYNTTATYELTVETPIISDEPVFQLCSVILNSAGNNLPCLALDKSTEYSARTTSGLYADRGVMFLGGITNLPIEASSTTANSVKVDVVFTPLDHPSATLSSQHDLAVSLAYAGRTEVTSHTFTVTGTSAATANVTSPDFNMTYAIGSDTVIVGLSKRVVLDIVTTPNSTYEKFDVEFIMPSGNVSSKFKVCRSKVLSAGKSVPCVTPHWFNKMVTYTSKFNDGIYNRAVLPFGGVCNTGLYSDVAEDQISIAVDLTVLQNDEMSTLERVSAGTMFSTTKIWVGQLSMNIDSGGAVAPNTPPYLGLIQNTTLTMTPIGYPMVYSLVMKVAPGDSVDLMVVVESQTPGLFVCGLRIMAAGDNFPCLDQTIEPVFDTWPSGDNKRATFNASYVTNCGPDPPLVNNDFYDDNTILFEIIVQLAQTVTDGTQLDFTSTATYASGQSNAITQTLTATSNTSSIDRNVTQSANFSFYMASIGTNDTEYVAFGEAKRLILDMTLPASMTSEYTVKMFTSPLVDPGYMEICGAAVIEVGKNFPCLRQTEIDPVFEKRPGSNYNGIATLYLGFICNSYMGTDEASNRIRVEGVFKLLHNTSSLAGDTHTVHVAVNNNDFEIFVSSYDLIQTDTFIPKTNNTIETNETTLYVNLTNNVIDMSVGVLTTLPVVFNIKPRSVSHVKFDIDTFTNNSVVALVKDIRLVGTGTNVACLYVDEALGQTFTPVLNSSLQTCQVDQGFLDLGVVSNPGLSYGKKEFKDGDNSVLLEVDIMLPDFELAEHNAEFPISLGGMVADIIVLCEPKIRVIRDNNEKPELEFTAEVNTSLTTDSQIFVDVVLGHTNTSSGTAVNASFLMFLPPYLYFSNLTRTNITPAELTKEPGFINVRFGNLLLCNAVDFTVLLESNNSVEVPLDIIPDNTIILLEAGSNVYQRSGSSLPSNSFLSTDTQYLNFSAKVTQDDACNTVLGMETGLIKDCQIASSVEDDPQHPAIHSRYKGSSAWSPFSHSVLLSPLRYLQVCFGNVTLVAKIIIERGNTTLFPHVVTSIALDYSNDDKAYERAEIIDVSGMFAANDEITVEPGRPTPARYIRIYLLSDNAGILPALLGLKVEFIGCTRSSDISSQGLPDVVGCLHGYDKTMDRLYAWHTNKRTMLMSMNDGDDWDTVSLDTYFTSRDNGKDNGQFLFSKPIGWQSNDEFNSAEPHANYQLGDWGATYKGLFFRSGGTWAQRVVWNAA